MAASSVATMIGADAASPMMSTEGIVAGRGKSFADSFDAHIAAGTDVELSKTAAEMGKTELQNALHLQMNSAGREDAVGASKLASGFDATDIAVQIVSGKKTGGSTVSLVAGSQAGVAAIDVKDLKMAEDSQVASVSDEEQARMPNTQADPAGVDTTGMVVAKASTETVGEARLRGAEQLESGKLQLQSGDSQPTNVSESVPSPFTKDEAVGMLQAQVAASDVAHKCVSSGGVSDAASAKEAGKKRDSAKSDASTKAADTSTNAAGVAADAAVPVACGAAGFGSMTACSMTAYAPSEPALVSSRQISSAALIGSQSVKQMVGAPQRSGERHGSVAGKPMDSGYAGTSGTDVHGAHKNAQTDGKSAQQASDVTAAQTTEQVAKSSGKLQGADAAASVLHSAGASAAVVGTSAGNSTALQLQAGGAQKNVPGDASASLSAAHGNADLAGAGAAGPQTPAMGEAHKTLVASPTVLEVGIPNGTQGWLKVRAELTNGGINASLATASPGGQEMLHRELPALTAFLQQEKVAVNSLVVQSPVAGRFHDASGGAGGFTGGHAQQQNQSRTGHEGALLAESAMHPDLSMQTDEALSIMQYPGGSWLSVRA